MAIEKVIGIKVQETGLDELNKSLGNTKKGLDGVDDSAGKTEKVFTSLKSQIKAASIELQKMAQIYGETSNEAIQAAKAVAELQDQMSFQKDLVKSYNPDEKFRGLSQAAAVSTIALGGVKDGMAALGIESEGLNKAIGAVEGITGVAGAVAGLGDAYGLLTAAKTKENIAEVEGEVVRKEGIISTTIQTVKTGIQTAATYVATIAQNIWNAAMAANPIGLLVLAIIAAVAAIGTLTYWIYSSIKANDELDASIMRQTRTLENQLAQSKKYEAGQQIAQKNAYALAEANGAGTKALQKLAISQNESTIKLQENNQVKLRSIFLSTQKALADAKENDASDEQIKKLEANTKKAYDAFKQGNENLSASYNKRHQIVKDNEIANAKIATDAREKVAKDAEDAEKARAEKSKAQRQKELELIKKHNDDIKAFEAGLLKDIATDKAKTDQEKLDLQKATQQTELDNLKLYGDEKIRIQAEFDAKYAALQIDLDAKTKKEAEEKVIKDREDAIKKAKEDQAFAEEVYLGKKEFTDALNEAEIESVRAHKQALLDIEEENKLKEIELAGGTPEEVAEKKQALVELYNQKELDNNKAASDKQVEIDKATFEAKKAIQEQGLDVISKGIGFLTSLNKKNKKLQAAGLIAENAVGVAKIIINTQLGNAAALAQGIAQAGPILGPGIAAPAILFNTISAGIGIAASVAATAKGLSELKEGGATGSAQQPAGAAAPAVSAPSFNLSQGTRTGAIIDGNQQRQQPIKTYVVSQDVTTAQQLDRNTIKNATL